MLYLILGAVALLLLPIVVLATLSALSTRPTNLGVTDGRLAPCPSSPNCVSTQAEDETHRIEPMHFSGSRDAAMQRLRSVVSSMPRVQVIAERDDYLYAEATSLIFRFVDDVEFLIDEEAKQIHFRSASRVGRSDFGANRGRMEQIHQAFDEG